MPIRLGCVIHVAQIDGRCRSFRLLGVTSTRLPWNAIGECCTRRTVSWNLYCRVAQACCRVPSTVFGRLGQLYGPATPLLCCWKLCTTRRTNYGMLRWTRLLLWMDQMKAPASSDHDVRGGKLTCCAVHRPNSEVWSALMSEAFAL